MKSYSQSTEKRHFFDYWTIKIIFVWFNGLRRLIVIFLVRWRRGNHFEWTAWHQENQLWRVVVRDSRKDGTLSDDDDSFSGIVSSTLGSFFVSHFSPFIMGTYSWELTRVKYDRVESTVYLFVLAYFCQLARACMTSIIFSLLLYIISESWITEIFKHF